MSNHRLPSPPSSTPSASPITPESKGTTVHPQPANPDPPVPPELQSPPHLGPLAASHEGIDRALSALPWLHGGVQRLSVDEPMF